ncbi:MAG TPA: DoxX family protein [Candidatus Binatia bacterium]|nr:DoxX family protein [Candidatus Binatia bacterium]
MKALLVQVLQRLESFDWLPILFARISVGVLFFESGRGKLFYRLNELVEYFTQLGIPFPHLQAPLVAAIELVGGICLILGFATRLICAPLTVIMAVAILTAQLDKVKTVGDFLYLPEVLLIVIFIWLIFSGPGKFAIDNSIARRLSYPNSAR